MLVYRYSAALTAAAALLALSSSLALAQGTVNGPTTQHYYESPDVWVGGPNDTINGPGPYPIALDVNGPPWIKEVYTPPTGLFGGGMVLHETIINAGNVPWWDWHERVTGIAIGANFDQVTSMRVNGQPITFNATNSGGGLTLDNFSQPVLPGDTLEIDKTLITTDNLVGPNTLLVTIEQYPTPEPTGLALLGLGGMVLLRQRR